MIFLVENVIRTVIFFVVAVQSLFPSNYILPFDRRLCSLLGAALCMICDRIFLHNTTAKNASLVQAGQHIDLFVILILLSIMIINFVIIGQPLVIKLLQLSNSCIRKNPGLGFWIISAIAFVVSPILMNDGVCILLVEPVLSAFAAEDSGLNRETPVTASDERGNSDELFFLLAVACSANIGSTCTFTGNPQNILIGESLEEEVMGFGQFVLLMVVPAIICWLITTAYLDHCRVRARSRHPAVSVSMMEQQGDADHEDNDGHSGQGSVRSGGYITISTSPYKEYSFVQSSGIDNDGMEIEMATVSTTNSHNDHHAQPMCDGKDGYTSTSSGSRRRIAEMDMDSDDVDLRHSEPVGGGMVGSSPILTVFWLAVLVAIEFSGVISLAAAYVLVAVFLVSSTLLSNYYSDVLFSRTRASSAEKRIQDISRYIEDLFNSIDYNIICIFIGLFVVAGSFLQTGIPSSLWKSLTGNLSPSSLTYMVVLCIFVTVASQLIGNVPVVYMARDQLLNDGDAWHRRYAGLLLAWVSTVAGNFTLVGSAANIIVAEKAMRYRKRPLMLTAAFHFKHCAAVTLLCIALGASILYLEVFVIYK